MLHKTFTACQIILLIVGIILAGCSIGLLAGGFDAIFNAILHNKLQVVNGSEAESIWIDTPIPMIMNVYFFNITNPDEFLEGYKPLLQEVGPYSYREFHHKEDLIYHPNMTVTFYQKRWWIWDQEASGNNSEDDVMTVFNTVPVAAAYTVRSNDILLSGLNSVMNRLGETAIVRATAVEILFDGFEDPLLTFVKEIIPDRNESLLNLPSGLLDYDKFGWFYKRNNSVTYDGLFNMFTGESGLEDVGLIDLWNQSNETSYFYEPCNRVEGSAGELWPPGLKKDILQFYSPDLCMTAKLYYQKEIKDSFGNPGYRFWGNDLTFANSTYVPENECYCIVKGDCSPTGLLDAQTCRMGAPAYVSFPHFLNADPALLDDLEGVHPDNEKHEFYIDINPDLGVPLSVAARMQINLRIQSYPGHGALKAGKIDILADVPELILPMIWFEVIATMTEELSNDISPAIFLSNSPTMTIIFSLLLFLGFILICQFIFVSVKRRKSKQEFH